MGADPIDGGGVVPDLFGLQQRGHLLRASSGPMREAGGAIRVAKGGLGAPLSVSTVTSASPVPSVVSVSSTS